MKEEIVDNDEIINIVNETKITIKEDRYNNDSIKNLKIDNPDKIIKLEEDLLNYMGESDLQFLKTEIPDNKWKSLIKKLAYPYEYFNSLDDYQKPVDNLKKEDFFSESKNKCPDDTKIERAKGIIKAFNIKNGEELTRLYLKSDVLLLACVFEKFFKNIN